MFPTKLTKGQADEVWQILIEEAGVSPNNESMKASFTSYFVEEEGDFKEFRFCGSLGFGGKIKLNLGRLYTTCYSEDLTDARKQSVLAANERLSQIKLFSP